MLVHFVRNRVRNHDLYLGHVNLSFWGEQGDVFGNLRAIARLEADAPHPVRVTWTPIEQEQWHWRTYMGRHGPNTPHRYHNGGIWPFVGGYWALAHHGGRP